MVLHGSLVCVFLLTLTYAIRIQARQIENCGFNLTATCEAEMVLYADGKRLATSNDWERTSSVYIPENTQDIQIHCEDGWIHGGIIASSENGLKTDDNWSCSSDNGNTWSSAYAFGRNGGKLPTISPDAQWIWTEMNTWQHADNQEHTNAICKFDLSSSQCSTTGSGSSGNSGFDLYASCYEQMRLVVDGQELKTKGDDNNWRKAKKARIPPDANALEIHCEDGFYGAGGIIASGDNGVITNGDWSCSTDDGATWISAIEIEPNALRPSGISSSAKWIWSENYTCNSVQHKNVICKINLDDVVGSSNPVVTVLPANLASNLISGKDQQAHCCKWRTFGRDHYQISGVLKDSIWQTHGCLDSCAFDSFTTSDFVCFSSDGSECKQPSDKYTEYNNDATENKDKFLTVLDLKTKQYGDITRFPKLTDKLDYIKQDIADNAHNSRKKRSYFPVPKEVSHYMGKVTDIYNAHDHHDNVEKELDSLQEDLKNNYNKYHQVSHFLIQNTRMVSKISKTEDNGGNDGINKFWDAVTAHTDAETARSIKTRVKRSGCDSSVLSNTLTTTATGCLAGPEGCAAGAITGGVTGIASCVPDVVTAISGGCFASTSLVETISGVKKISELVIGDFIRTTSPSGGFKASFTEFLGWLDRQMSAPVEMLQVSTTLGQSTLTLTASHIVFTGKDTKYADKLQPGDFLMHWNGTHIVDQEVTEIRKTYETGFWAPLTRDGTLLVDGYLTSCYASFPHQIADFAMIPVKAMPTFLLENEESQHKDGVRSVVKIIKRAGELIGVRNTKKEVNKFPSSAIDRATKACQVISKSEF